MSKLNLKKIIKDIEAKVEYLETHVVSKIDIGEEIQALKNFAAEFEGAPAEVAAPKAVEEVPITVADAPPEVVGKNAFGK